MSGTHCTTKHAVAAVSCVWFPDHAKDAKSLLEQALGFGRREEIVLENHVYITIEAAGSGKVLVSLQVNRAASIRQLKEEIFGKLCNTNKGWSCWRDIRLFQGHGGPELDETRASLARDTTLVLATRLVKTGVFFSENQKCKLNCVFLANEYLVTQIFNHTQLWDLWTGKSLYRFEATTISVGDELFVTGQFVRHGVRLDVCALKDRAPRYTFTVSGGCRRAYILRHDTLLVVVGGYQICVHDVLGRCRLWTGKNICHGMCGNMRISPTGDLVTFSVHDTRHFLSKDGSNGFATVQHEQLCHVPQPALTVSLVHGGRNVMVVRNTC